MVFSKEHKQLQMERLQLNKDPRVSALRHVMLSSCSCSCNSGVLFCIGVRCDARRGGSVSSSPRKKR